MNPSYRTRSERPVSFTATGDPRTPYGASVDGERWMVRMNEFPAEPSLYTLLVDGVATEELLEWPSAWTRPEDALERAELERELAHFERTRAIAPSKFVK